MPGRRAGCWRTCGESGWKNGPWHVTRKWKNWRQQATWRSGAANADILLSGLQTESQRSPPALKVRADSDDYSLTIHNIQVFLDTHVLCYWNSRRLRCD